MRIVIMLCVCLLSSATSGCVDPNRTSQSDTALPRGATSISADSVTLVPRTFQNYGGAGLVAEYDLSNSSDSEQMLEIGWSDGHLWSGFVGKRLAPHRDSKLRIMLAGDGQVLVMQIAVGQDEPSGDEINEISGFCHSYQKLGIPRVSPIRFQQLGEEKVSGTNSIVSAI